MLAGRVDGISDDLAGRSRAAAPGRVKTTISTTAAATVMAIAAILGTERHQGPPGSGPGPFSGPPGPAPPGGTDGGPVGVPGIVGGGGVGPCCEGPERGPEGVLSGGRSAAVRQSRAALLSSVGVIQRGKLDTGIGVNAGEGYKYPYSRITCLLCASHPYGPQADAVGPPNGRSARPLLSVAA